MNVAGGPEGFSEPHFLTNPTSIPSSLGSESSSRASDLARMGSESSSRASNLSSSPSDLASSPSDLASSPSDLASSPSTLRARLRTLRARLRTLRARLRTLRCRARGLRAGLRTLRAGLRTLRCRARSLRAGLRTLRCRARSLRAGLRTLRGWAQSLRAGLRTLRGRAQSLRAGLRTLRAPLRSLRARPRTLRAPLRSLRVRPRTLRCGAGSLRAGLRTLRARLRTLRARARGLRAGLRTLRARLWTQRARRSDPSRSKVGRISPCARSSRSASRSPALPARALRSALRPGPPCRRARWRSPAPPIGASTPTARRLRDGARPGRLLARRQRAAGGASSRPTCPSTTRRATSTRRSPRTWTAPRRWGIDVMRVPFTWAALEPTQGHDDEDCLRATTRSSTPRGRAASGRSSTSTRTSTPRTSAATASPPGPSRDAARPAPRLPGLVPRVLRRRRRARPRSTRFWADGSPVQAAYFAALGRDGGAYKDKPGVLGFEPINEPAPGTADDGHLRGDHALRLLRARGRRTRARWRRRSLVFVDPPGLDGVT